MKTNTSEENDKILNLCTKMIESNLSTTFPQCLYRPLVFAQIVSHPLFIFCPILLKFPLFYLHINQTFATIVTGIILY